MLFLGHFNSQAAGRQGKLPPNQQSNDVWFCRCSWTIVDVLRLFFVMLLRLNFYL